MSSEVQPVFYVLSQFNTYYFVVDFVVVTASTFLFWNIIGFEHMPSDFWIDTVESKV